MLAARYFLGCLHSYDFFKLTEALSSSDETRLIEHTISYGIPVVYCDVSLQAFDMVVPAAGSTHSAVRIAPQRLAELAGAEWVDVCEHRS